MKIEDAVAWPCMAKLWKLMRFPFPNRVLFWGEASGFPNQCMNAGIQATRNQSSHESYPVNWDASWSMQYHAMACPSCPMFWHVGSLMTKPSPDGVAWANDEHPVEQEAIWINGNFLQKCGVKLLHIVAYGVERYDFPIRTWNRSTPFFSPWSHAARINPCPNTPCSHARINGTMVQNSSKFMISRMGKKKYGDAGGETLWLHKSHCSFRHWLGVSKFFLQMMSPITLPGGAWNFAARFLLSAAAGALGLWRFPGLSRPFQGGGGMACLWRLRSQPEWWVYSEICRHGPKTAEMRHSDDKGRPLKTWRTYSSALARWFWMILVYFGGNCSSYLSCLMNFMGKSGQYESQYLKRPILRTWAEVEWWACWREGERGELGGAFLHILCRKDCKGFMLCTAGLWPQDRWMR